MTEHRKLTTQEIGLVLHLLRCGDGRMPIAMLAGARQRLAQLAKIGLVDIWYRQSLTNNKLEGPFYTLTWNGRERAATLFLSRQSREAIATDLQLVQSRNPSVTPPHDLKEHYRARSQL